MDKPAGVAENIPPVFPVIIGVGLASAAQYELSEYAIVTISE